MSSTIVELIEWWLLKQGGFYIEFCFVVVFEYN